MSHDNAPPLNVPRMRFDVHTKSPIGMLKALTLMLRQRFDPSQKLSWCWTDDPNTRTIHIYPEFHANASQTSNLVPRLIIRRGTVAYMRANIADLGENHNTVEFFNGNIFYHQLAEMSVSIEAVAKTFLESCLLADLAQTAFAVGRTEFEREFNVRDVSPMALQPTQTLNEDSQLYSTSIQMRIAYEYHWVALTPGPRLAGYDLTITDGPGNRQTELSGSP